MRIMEKSVLILFILLTIGIPLSTYAVPTARQLIKPVNYPLPSQPEPVLVGEPFKVVVEAENDAFGWKMKLKDDYTSTWAPFINSNLNGKFWTIFFTIPEDQKPNLYDVNIAYTSAGKDVNYTQPRSAWILKEWPDSLTIGQITDLHMPYGADNLAKFVYEANLLKPDIIVTTGDNVDTETIASAWAYLQSIFNRLEVPSYLVPGNHDHAGAKSEYYQLYGGRLNYTVTIGKFLIVAMDSGDNGYLTMEEMQWASKILANNPDKVKILIFHHPLLSRDIGTHVVDDKGGDITGDWTKSSELVNLMHLGWCDRDATGKYVPKPEATELLKMVQIYDVRLILNGHVHSDVIHILNGRHWFITTAALGGGVTPPMYNDYRIVTIDNTGKVSLDPIGQRNLLNPPNGIPVGSIRYYYKINNDGTKTTVTAVASNELDVTFTNAQLEFLVSTSKSFSEYKFHGTQPKRYEISTTSFGYRVNAYIDIPAKTMTTLTLSAESDSLKPSIKIIPPTQPYNKGQDVPLTVEASDNGWGVKNVQVSYAFEMDSRWWDLETPFKINIDKDNNILTYPSESYSLTIPSSRGYELRIKAEALDFAGNKETVETTIKANSPPQPLKKTFKLTINSDPSVVQITMNGQVKTTPYTETLDEGTYTVISPESIQIGGKSYIFSKWSDGSTNKNRTITLSANTSLSLIYTLISSPTTQPTQPPSQPSGGIPLPVPFAIIGVFLSVAILLILKNGKVKTPNSFFPSQNTDQVAFVQSF